MPAQTRNLYWYHADEGLVPTAARQPWAIDGTATLTLTPDTDLEVAAATELGLLSTPLGPKDLSTTAPRASARVEVQARLRGVSFTAAWASGASPIIIGIDDGARPVAVSIGPQLQWINPLTGDVLGQAIDESFAWLLEHDYRLVKERGARFSIWVDGRQLATLPFGAVPPRPTTLTAPPRFLWAHADPGGSSVARWTSVEAALNEPIPAQWVVDRQRNVAASLVAAAYSRNTRALWRTVVGAAQGVVNALEEVGSLVLAGRDSFDRFEFDGASSPAAEAPAWVLSEPTPHTIVRERIRFGGTTDRWDAEARFASSLEVEAEVRVRARFTLLENSVQADASDRAGPFLEVENGHRRIRADLIRGTGAQANEYGWVLTERTGLADADPVATRGQWRWFVNPFEPHDVEIQVLGRDVVMLLVNDRWVDCIDYGDFTDTSGTLDTLARVGGWAHAGLVASIEAEDTIAEVRYCDLARREFFLQRIAERGVFTGGCERNDLLDTLLRTRYRLWEARGTSKGIELEAQRLSCSRDTTLVVKSREAGWYLGVTCPIGQLIYLDSPAQFHTAHLEVHHNAPNFTIEQLALLLQRYVVPIGVMLLRYSIDLARLLTSPAAAGTATTFTVASTAGFEVGDVVTLHDAANATSEQATITDIPVAGSVEVDELLNPYVAGATMRKTLLES